MRALVVLLVLIVTVAAAGGLRRLVRDESEVERDLRDAIGGTLYSGTSDIQRVIIARWLGL